MDRSKIGKAANRHGYYGEVAVAEKMNRAFPGHHFVRIGGTEKRKRSMGGDVLCLQSNRPGKPRCTWGSDCPLRRLYVDVKYRKSVSVPSWWAKVVDDATMFDINNEPVLIWMKDTKKYKGWMVRWSSDPTQYTFDEWVEVINRIYGEDEVSS